MPIRPPETSPVDWPRLILEVRRAGYTMSEMGFWTGIPKSTISGYLTLDAEPNYRYGATLVQFWSQITGKPPSDVPKAADRVK